MLQCQPPLVIDCPPWMSLPERLRRASPHPTLFPGLSAIACRFVGRREGPVDVPAVKQFSPVGDRTRLSMDKKGQPAGRVQLDFEG